MVLFSKFKTLEKYLSKIAGKETKRRTSEGSVMVERESEDNRKKAKQMGLFMFGYRSS